MDGRDLSRDLGKGLLSVDLAGELAVRQSQIVSRFNRSLMSRVEPWMPAEDAVRHEATARTSVGTVPPPRGGAGGQPVARWSDAATIAVHSACACSPESGAMISEKWRPTISEGDHPVIGSMASDMNVKTPVSSVS